MTSIRNWLAGTALTAGALLSAGALLTAATAADTTTTPAPAAPGPHAGWHHHHHHHGFPYAKLGLTDAQKTAIKNLHQASMAKVKPLFEQMRSNSAKLKTMAPNDPQYLTTVQEVAEANAPLKAQLVEAQAAVHQQIYTTVLTSSQQTQFLQLRAQAQQRMQERMQQHAAAAGAQS